MKQKIFTYSTFALLLGIMGCTQDGLPTDGAEGTPMTFTATGLNFPEARSRTTVDGKWTGVSTVAVKIGDEVKAYTVTPSADNSSATLTSDAPFYWTDLNQKTVTAWCPYTDSSVEMPPVVVQSDQSGVGFAKSDFIAAENQVVSFGDTSLKFTHRTACLKVTLLASGEGIGSVDGATLSFINLDTTNGNPASITPKNEAGTAVYEALVAPQTIAKGTTFISVTLNGTDYTYTPKTVDIELEAGFRYNYTLRLSSIGLELEEVSGGTWADSGDSEEITSREILVRYTADDVKKGDYIYQDGTTSDGGLRLIYVDGEMVTAPEKPQPIIDDANPVVGIVFWTPSETIPQKGRQTPASLTDDKIMAAEHSGCTNGLAVALKNVTYDDIVTMAWQNQSEIVAEFQSGDNFIHGSKDDFESISSGTGATDPINYILGYQNTVVLRAYNTYCQKNNKSGYIVQPVAAIKEFAKNNLAPENSTGWFLPSPKELHILCYMDVDNIADDNNRGSNTRDLINSSLTEVGGDDLIRQTYWSSCEIGMSFARGVSLSNGNVNGKPTKPTDYYVRPIFAF